MIGLDFVWFTWILSELGYHLFGCYTQFFTLLYSAAISCTPNISYIFRTKVQSSAKVVLHFEGLHFIRSKINPISQTLFQLIILNLICTTLYLSCIVFVYSANHYVSRLDTQFLVLQTSVYIPHYFSFTLHSCQFLRINTLCPSVL